MERKKMTQPSEAWVGGDSFVQVMNISLDSENNQLMLHMEIMNLHAFDLVSLEYQILFFDTGKNLLSKEAIIVQDHSATIKSGTIASVSPYNVTEFPVARKAQVRLISGVFSDGNTLDLVYEKMEKIIFNPLEEHEIALLKNAVGADAYCLAKSETSSWRCVCGYFNGYTSENCSNCGRSGKLVLQQYGDFTSLMDIKEEKSEEVIEEIAKEEKEHENVNFIDIIQFLNRMPAWIILLFVLSFMMLGASVFLWLNKFY